MPRESTKYYSPLPRKEAGDSCQVEYNSPFQPTNFHVHSPTVTPQPALLPQSTQSAQHSMTTQIQEEFNKHKEEFKQQQLRNANFDFQIGKLETTTEWIDSNVDEILYLLRNSGHNKAPRLTEAMMCDTEERSGPSVRFVEEHT